MPATEQLLLSYHMSTLKPMVSRNSFCFHSKSLLTYISGIVSGLVGSIGNFGGIIGAIIFRYNGVNYGKSIWIIGILSITINLFCAWIRPIPKGQIGGR